MCISGERRKRQLKFKEVNEKNVSRIFGRRGEVP